MQGAAVFKNECKNEVHILLKLMQHCPGEKFSGVRVFKTLPVSDQVSIAFRAAKNIF